MTTDILTENINAKQLSPITLAFMGDAVFEQLVRHTLISQYGTMPADRLHRMAVWWVRASTQAKMADVLVNIFSEDEMAVFKRGRNANSIRAPKNSSPSDYRKATGLEAVFGYLHFLDKNDRIIELFDIVISNMNNIESDIKDERNVKATQN